MENRFVKNKSKFIAKYVHIIKRKKKFTLKLFTRSSGSFPSLFHCVISVLKNPSWLELWFDRKSEPKMKIQMFFFVIAISLAIQGYGKQVPSKKLIKSWIHKQSNALQFPRSLLSLLSGTVKINNNMIRTTLKWTTTKKRWIVENEKTNKKVTKILIVQVTTAAIATKKSSSHKQQRIFLNDLWKVKFFNFIHYLLPLQCMASGCVISVLKSVWMSSFSFSSCLDEKFDIIFTGLVGE